MELPRVRPTFGLLQLNLLEEVLKGAVLLALHDPHHHLLHRVGLEEVLLQALGEALVVVATGALLEHSHGREGEQGDVLALLERGLVVAKPTT